MTEKEGTSPIRILNIAHILQQKIIYLTGSKDKEGHPLLVCTGTNATAISAKNFQEAVQYLLYMSSLLWEDYKFVVIMDCQTNKWAHVKALMQLMQPCFEKDQIHHIFLIKPQGFLQRHFSANDSKNIKLNSIAEITFLDSASVLLDHFDQMDLPDSFGGIDSFDVVEWVEYTTAVERFQQTCSKVNDRLKHVDYLFADKYPLSSINEIESLFKQQEQLIEDITNDIHCAVEISETLSPIVNKPLSHRRKEPSPLQKYNSAEFNVCSENLCNFQKRLNTLWEEQKVYLEQAKELCRFEQSFGEVSRNLLIITSILEGRVDIGDSLRSAKDLMLELDDFKRKQMDSYKEMMKLKEKGLQMLVVFGSFAKVSIKYRIDEIKLLCNDFETKLEARRELLQVSLDVFTCLDQLELWYKAGMDLLASQPVENFSSEVGAKKCLQEIDDFMKNGQGINMKKMNQLNTLCKELQKPSIDAKVKEALERIENVKSKLENRETSLKKMAIKPVRPVQPVKALSIEVPETTKNPTTRVFSPTVPVNKSEIEIVVTDDIENYKRNKTFRKSLRGSMRRPLSSPAQLQRAESEEDPEYRKKIRHVITELINTEEDYVNDLKCIVEGYFVEFDDPNFDIPPGLRQRKDCIFGNIVEIYNFHKDHFLEELKACREAPYLAGQAFINKREEFQLYATYCKNKPKSEALRRKLHQTTFLTMCQKKLGHQLNLDSYLLKPVQRITKYQLLLTEMLKYVSKKNPAHLDILDALSTMKKVLRHVNDVMHSSGLVGFAGNLDDQGKLLLHDTFTVWEVKKSSLKHFTKLGGKTRQVFMFERSIIFSKKEYENGKELGTYLCKLYLKTADIGLTEKVRGDECRFEISVQRKHESYIMQSENLEVKNNWVSEIKKILMSQFENVKETMRRVSRDESRESVLTKEDMKNKLTCKDKSLSTSHPIISLSEDDNNNKRSSRTNLSPSPINPAKSLVDLTIACEGGYDESDWSDSDFEDEPEEEENMEEETGSILSASTSNTNIAASISNTNIAATQNIANISADVSGSKTSLKDEVGANTFIAIADYSSFEHSELAFDEGDLVNLIKEGHGGWWFCKHLKSQEEGWVPSGYLEIHAVDVTNGPEQTEKQKITPERPTQLSPRKRLETAV